MALIISIILSLFLPSPWNWLLIAGGVCVEVAEVTWGLRLARRWKPKTGAEAMIGMVGEAVSPLDPSGQVRVNGELWGARSTSSAAPGDPVVIKEIDGLTLVVDAAPDGESAPQDVPSA